MAVPSQQDLHRPILEIVSGANDDVVPLQQVKAALIQRFSLDDKHLAERVPSEPKRFSNNGRHREHRYRIGRRFR